MSDQVKLQVKNKDYIGAWEEIFITRAVNEASSSFSVQATIPNTPEFNGFRFDKGDEVKVYYGRDLLITGYIETITIEYDGNNSRTVIEGNSTTIDLVDSSSTEFGQFANQTLGEIVEKLCKEYKVQVVVDADIKDKIASFQIKTDGETVYDAIQRLADTQGLNVSDTPDGKLLLYFVGKNKSKNQIVVDKHTNTGVLSCRASQSEKNEYSKIVVKGQKESYDDESDFGKKSSQIMEQAVSTTMTRQRVKVIRADTQLTKEKAIERAMTEQQASSGMSNELFYTVQGWRGNAGELWREGTTVNVFDVRCNIDHVPFSISKVEYIINNSGTIAQLTMYPDYAFKKPKVDLDKNELNEGKAASWTFGDVIKKEKPKK